jgi:glycosyltransferase involved in cell wall biosynthesis
VLWSVRVQKVSVIIPAFNEAGALRQGKLQRVAAWLAMQPYPTELIVVDDGSSDETYALAQAAGVRTIRIEHAGKAAAIIAGIHASSGDIVLFTDMDQATPITEAPRLLERLFHAPGIAIGSRGLVRKGAPLGRYILSYGQVLARWVLLGLRITDTQCGFKAVHRAAALEILDYLKLYHPSKAGKLSGPSVTSGFDVEFLFMGQRLGYPIYEEPVIWNYQDTRRVHLLRDALRGMRDLLRIAWARLLGAYPRRARNGRLARRGENTRKV